MKTIFTLSILAIFVLVGCQSNAVLPDPTNSTKRLPPGTKTKDVLLPIDK